MKEDKTPFSVSLKKGQHYAWCSCSHSKNQPFCDGSHTKTDKNPVIFKAEEDRNVFLCGCKESSDAPFCNGTHLSM